MMSETQSPKPQTPAKEAEEDANPREVDFVSNKSFLLSSSSKSGLNLYDHLVVCLKKILEEKPQNVVDIFEEISRESKRSRFSTKVDTVRNFADRSSEVELALLQKDLFEAPEGFDEDALADEELESALPNLLKIAFMFEQAGIGIDKEELYRLWLSMQRLEQQHQLEKMRFWGKLFGTEQSYYVVEALFKPDAADEADDQEQQQRQSAAEEAGEAAAEAAEDEDGQPEDVEDLIPQPDFKPLQQAPREDPGSGANKFVYFVCNQPGGAWSRLPHVMPNQIQIARKIKKFFTGNLSAEVISYPPFPGNEANLLRAQIGRITAGTLISPHDYYRLDEEEEEDEEAGGRDTFLENEEFEKMSVLELVDSDLHGWVHHAQYLLPQGRTRWWNPVQRSEEEAEEDEDDEDKEEMDEPQPEEGVPLLHPLTEDSEVDGQSAWTARLSSNLLPQYAVAVISSNAWPGSHTVSDGREFDSVYIGWGQKYSSENYSPPPPPAVQVEFPSGPEITETEDPTPEEEAAARAAMAEAEEGGEEEGAEEEEEEEEDDD